MGTIDYTSDDKYTLMVIGKAGIGKSSLCNALLGDRRFTVGRGMSTTTVTAQAETAFRGNMLLKVVDTPDITNCGLEDAQSRREEVAKWRQMTVPQLNAVLLTVRCDIRYTAEEFAVYREIMNHWGDDSLKQRLVVVFTFGDRQDMPIEEELREVCPELTAVLEDAGQQYVLFDNTSEQSRSAVISDVLSAIERRKTSGPYCADRVRKDNTAAPRSFSPWSVPVLLMALLLITTTCCQIFVTLDIIEAVIGCGALGFLVVIALVVSVCRIQEGCYDTNSHARAHTYRTKKFKVKNVSTSDQAKGSKV